MDIPSTIRPKAKTFIAKNGSFLEKEFLAKGVCGRKIELDDIVDPELEIQSGIPEGVPEASPTDGADVEAPIVPPGLQDRVPHLNGMVTLLAWSC